MEQDSNPNGLCKNGCGFYGTHSFEGMCSKCYKDLVKRQQQHPSPSAGRRSPGSCGAPLSALPVTQTAAAVTAAASVNEPTPNIDFASAVVTRSQGKVDSFASESDSSATDSSSSLSLDDVTDASPGKSKRNRCYSCRKKVGLTGFECRCGGLFCGIHRYSDKHNCTYDYKSDAREQIAKANPVVVGEKVKKI